jgi:hypothetical protein
MCVSSLSIFHSLVFVYSRSMRSGNHVSEKWKVAEATMNGNFLQKKTKKLCPETLCNTKFPDVERGAHNTNPM